MHDTARELSERRLKPESSSVASTQPLALEVQSPKLAEAKSPSKSLSVSVSEHLLKLMQEVTSQEINPKTVNAAVNCATAIHKFITLNLRMKPKSEALPVPVVRPIQDVEKEAILEALKVHKGNRTHAARALGISLRSMRIKAQELKSLGFDVPPAPGGE